MSRRAKRGNFARSRGSKLRVFGLICVMRAHTSNQRRTRSVLTPANRLGSALHRLPPSTFAFYIILECTVSCYYCHGCYIVVVVVILSLLCCCLLRILDFLSIVSRCIAVSPFVACLFLSVHALHSFFVFRLASCTPPLPSSSLDLSSLFGGAGLPEICRRLPRPREIYTCRMRDRWKVDQSGRIDPS